MIRIQTQNSTILADRYIEELQRHLGDLTPLMEDIGTYLEGSTRDRFATKTAPSGVKWANLLPQTQAKKGNNNILVQSGNLMQSITYHATPNSMQIIADKPYGKFHQKGTKHMVARPFLGLSADDQQEIFAIINDYLTEIKS